MATYSIDRLRPGMVRCDACHQDVVAVEGADLAAIPELTAQQVIQARPELAAHISRHEAECPATQKSEAPPPLGREAAPGPWRRFAREARWSLAFFLVGLGLLATSLLLSPGAQAGGLTDRVIAPVLLGAGGLLTLVGVWWTIRTVAKMAEEATIPGWAWLLLVLAIILLLGGGAWLLFR